MPEFQSIREGGLAVAAILACGVCALCVFVERLIALHRARIRFSDFLAGIFNILSKGKWREAVAICDETPGPVARIAHTAILHRSDTPAHLRDVLRNAGRAEVSRLERRLRVFSAIIHSAPMLGLIGAAVGSLDSVRAIQAGYPLVQATDLTGGLSAALISTASGLAVAVVTYLMSTVVIVRIDRVILDMEQATADILAFMPTLGAASGDAINADSGNGK